MIRPFGTHPPFHRKVGAALFLLILFLFIFFLHVPKEEKE